ncbi:GNAT family N-acetyltransferase [Yimella sp. cx-573]|nr:GNAT family N-acetyltransferase [Yimella sp. cx-573]
MTDTQISIRQITPDEAEFFLETDELIWAADGDGPLEMRLRNTPVRAGFVAEREGETAGICASWDMQLAVPDGRETSRLVPVEGLTWVGVHPDHRRRGVLREMMRHHLRWTRDVKGRSLAALKASEPGIYGRFGYGLASQVLRASFGRGTTFAAPAAVVEVADRTTTKFSVTGADDAERLRNLQLRCATSGPAGTIVRSLEDVERHLTHVPEWHRGSEPSRVLWATRDREDVGFAVFRRTPKWTDGSPAGQVDVWLFGAVDIGARLALMRRLVDFDLMSTTVNWMALDDPLLLWVPSARGMGDGVTDSLWLRLVDLPAAVADRGHAAEVDVTVRVRDNIINENDGVWRWTTDAGGSGRIEPSDGDPDLTLDIHDLGAIWLGGQTLGARRLAGFLEEHTAGAVARLDAALRTPTAPLKSSDF